MLRGFDIQTGLDLNRPIEAGEFIWVAVGRASNSKVARPVMVKRSMAAWRGIRRSKDEGAGDNERQAWTTHSLAAVTSISCFTNGSTSCRFASVLFTRNTRVRHLTRSSS